MSVRTPSRLAMLRRAAGVSQVDAAKAIGRTQAVISRAEAGERPLAEQEAKALGRLYGVDWRKLVRAAPSTPRG